MSGHLDSDDLLTNALEKLLFLESRLEAAEAGREIAERDATRHRAASGEARKLLLELQRRVLHAEVSAESADREAAKLRGAIDATRRDTDAESLRARLLEAEASIARFVRERETWLDRMAAMTRLRSGSDDALDLGSFIAELRAEIISLRAGTASAHETPPLDPETIVAAIPEGQLDVEVLLASAQLTRPERTLAAACARDLDDTAPMLRRQAAERLARASIGALNPLLIRRFSTEPDAAVRVAFVKVIDASGGPEGAQLVFDAAMSDPDARVRTEALAAAARHGSDRIADAMADKDAAVRRRVLTLLDRSGFSLDVVADAISDNDASVRKVAAYSLASRAGPEAEALLREASTSSDAMVAGICLKALARRGPAHAVSIPPRPAPTPHDQRVIDEVRMAIRGRTVEELVESLGLTLDDVGGAAARLVTNGTLLWRGKKLYPA